ncbi:hypothetical protein RHH66_005327 [Escherichia coli]|nr:hypothetical protein [Escherichia coli]
METVFDALKAMGKASSQEVAARLGMTRDEAINELWKLIIETGIAGGDFEDVFEVDDDATPDEIKDEAKEIFFN